MSQKENRRPSELNFWPEPTPFLHLHPAHEPAPNPGLNQNNDKEQNSAQDED